jgi:hypothetical protein
LSRTVVFVVLALVAGCTHNFDAFDPTTASAEGGTGTPDATSATDGHVSGTDTGTGNEPDTSGPLPDGSVPDTSQPPPEAGPDASCPISCEATATGCRTTCVQTFNTCNAACPTGNAGKTCRTTCQTNETNCTQGCLGTCESCTLQAGCSDPQGCQAAVQ